jgi:hypothetical protein
MQDTFYARFRLWILIGLLVALPVIFWGANSAWEGSRNSILDWLPPSFDETKQIFWFDEKFGGDELLMVSWDDCKLGDQRLAAFAERLRAPPKGESAPLFQTVITGSEIYDQLRSAPLKLETREAQSRMRGWLLGKDRKTTGVIALVSEAGEADRHAAVEHAYNCAEQVQGLSRGQLRVAGATMEGVAIDRVSKASLPLLANLSFLACFAIMFACFRNLRLAIFIFALAIINHFFSMALIHYTGVRMDSILMMVPSLIFVLTVSAGVHLANYYRDAVVEHGFELAAVRAVSSGWAPCWLAATTTAIGLISLVRSELVPVDRFGTFSALTVVAGTGILFLVLPSLLEQWPPRRWARRLRDQQADIGISPPRWRTVHRLVTTFRVPIIVLATALLVVTGWGVTRIQPSAKIHNMFAPESRVLSDYKWIETNIGPLVPVEIVVHIPIPSEHSVVDRMQLVERVRKVVASVDGVDSTISAATFGPSLPADRFGLSGAVRRVAIKRALQRHRDWFIANHYLSLNDAPAEEMWRISGRVWAGRDIDYGAVLRQIEERVEQQVAAPLRDQGWSGVHLTYCGGVPLVQKAQDQLLLDLINSFLVAFGLIAVAMIFLLRNITAGLLSMIPNILPSVAVFGWMGWTGVEMEIGSMMTASAALGIAVDDTLHFVTWFRRGMLQGMARREATAYAYERCGMAMVQTSLICGLGLLVYALSPFAPFAKFAWLMFTMLLAAIVADLVVLPAILDSPLGRVFAPKSRTPQPEH